MSKIYEILLIGILLSIMIQSAMATDQQEYTCIDKVDTKSLPSIPQSINIDKSIEKVPLCSQGKVPKAILPDIIIDNKYAKESIIEPLNNINTVCDVICYDWVSSKQDVYNLGASAYLTQHNPFIDPINGKYSFAEIRVHSDAGIVAVGWQKTVFDETRLITSWWKDNYDFQCNYDECGWVQISNYYFPGMPLNQNNNGIYYEIRNYNGDWWIMWNGEWLGYYPGYLWEGRFSKGNRVIYEGEIGSKVPIKVTSTDMGNGLWASSTSAAKIYSQKYLDLYGNWNYATTTKYTSAPSLYSVVSTSPSSMRYGGPGGNIKVISPNGQEYWQPGTTHTIRWSYTGTPGPYVMIELLKGGVFNRAITWKTENDGYYSWTIPGSIIQYSNYKVRITSISNPGYKDTSDNNFVISN